jgi:hypothetical protein
MKRRLATFLIVLGAAIAAVGQGAPAMGSAPQGNSTGGGTAGPAYVVPSWARAGVAADNAAAAYLKAQLDAGDTTLTLPPGFVTGRGLRCAHPMNRTASILRCRPATIWPRSTTLRARESVQARGNGLLGHRSQVLHLRSSVHTQYDADHDR